MAVRTRHKPEDILWPVTERTIEAIDHNFEIIFRDLSRTAAAGVLPVVEGGTGTFTFDQGDLVVALADDLLGAVPAVAPNFALISDGEKKIPVWGKIGLGTHITGTLPIANGGTSATDKATAFNNLSPLTTKGDVVAHTGTANARVAVGPDGQMLVASSAAAAGVAWAPLDPTLVAIAAFNTNGLLTQTAPDVFTGRSVAVTAQQGIQVANGSGVSGNPTLALDLANVPTKVTPLAADAVLIYDVAAGLPKLATLPTLAGGIGLGQWIDVAYSASNFGATGPMTWGVEAADQISLAYVIIGKTMIVSWNINTTTVGGTADYGLRFMIPASKTAARTTNGTLVYYEGAGYLLGYAQVNSSGVFVECYKSPLAKWTLTTNVTAVSGTIIFPIL